LHPALVLRFTLNRLESRFVWNSHPIWLTNMLLLVDLLLVRQLQLDVHSKQTCIHTTTFVCNCCLEKFNLSFP
jgi:hypothetical protein